MADFEQFVSGWNLNKGYYDHINEVIVGVDIAAYKDDPFAWRKFLRMVYRKVHKRLKAKSLETINALFKQVDEALQWDGIDNSQEGQSLRIAKTREALELLDQLEIAILDEMHEEDMLPNKTERTPPERAVEDFGYG